MSTFVSQMLSMKFLVMSLICGSVFAAVAYGVTRLIRGAFQVPWKWLGRIFLVTVLVAAIVWLPRRYPPEEIVNVQRSYTGAFLKPVLARKEKRTKRMTAAE